MTPSAAEHEDIIASGQGNLLSKAIDAGVSQQHEAIRLQRMNLTQRISRILRPKSGRNRKLPANIDLARNFLFVHIPKTAGTSVYQSLGLERSHHYFMSDYRKYLDAETFAQLYKFAFVRHPVQRFISLYKYARMDISHFHNNIAPEKAPFGEHADYLLLKDASLHECAVFLQEGRLTHNQPWALWLPQSRWLEIDGQLAPMDFIGRMENFAVDFQQLLNNIGIATSPAYVNRSASPDSDIEIDAKTLAILRHYYAEDLANFGYAL